MYSIILCGGSGSRLWPLSRKNFPKQFLKLYSNKSLLQETYLRMSEIVPKDNILFVTNEENYFNVFNQVKEIYPKFKKERVLIEPASLNTAPAIAYAVKYLTSVMKVKQDEPIVEVHSDHYIGNKDSYVELMKSVMKQVDGHIATIGIVPSKPDIGLGYIRKGKRIGDHFEVVEFKEKPNLVTAKKYLKSGKYLWNAGMYAFNSRTFAQELKKYAPEIAKIFEKDYDAFLKNFKKIPSVAIDVAIAEKSKNIVVFEGDFGWSDIGSFDVLAEISEKNGNISTKNVGFDSRNVFVHSNNDRLIATVGIDDIIVVENNDCILIQKRGRSADVKEVFSMLKEKQAKELDQSLEVYRPWGKYEVLMDVPEYKVKKITVFVKSRLSLQSHKKRSEHWVVVKGKAKIIRGKDIIHLKENESTYIPSKTRHRLENVGKENLEIIEVQAGKYLEEDDIKRYEDDYERN
jgi:mannose-1-phosphate guanylyltransferase/mannose-6-phosphate isomerase